MTVRRLRRAEWTKHPILPDTVDWADVRAVAVLSRSVDGDDLLMGMPPVGYVLDALETYQHTARAAAEIARALREVSA